MEFTLAPLYYGLLIILSLFFYNSVEDGSLIEGSQKLYDTITEKSEILKDDIIQYFGLEDISFDSFENIVNNISKFETEIEVEELKQENLILTKLNFIIEYLKSLKIIEDFKQSSLYFKLEAITNSFKDRIYNYFDENPEVGEFISNIWVNLNIYYQTAYEIIELRINVISSYLKENFDIIYDKILSNETVNSILTKYIEFYDIYVYPKLEIAKTYIDERLVENESSKETVYTFLIVIFSTIIISFFITNFFKLFAKETYNIKEATENIYKNQKYTENRDNSIYDEFKIKPWEEKSSDWEEDDDDENVELTTKKGKASNRSQEQQKNQGSNRRNQESRIEEKSKEKEEETFEKLNENVKKDLPEEVIETNETEELDKQVIAVENKTEENIPEEINLEGKKNDKEEDDNNGDDKDEEKEKEGNNEKEGDDKINHKTIRTDKENKGNNTKLMYVASKSIIYEDSNNSTHSYDLSCNATSEVTLAIDDHIQRAKSNRTVSNGEESEARSSVRSLLL